MRMFSEVKSTIVHGLNLVYTICVATTLLAAIVFRIHYVSPKYGSFNIIIHSVIFIQQILIATAILAIYYQTIRSPYGMTTVFQMLANVDRAFAQFNVKFDYRLFHWKVLIEIIILTASIHIAFAALCIHYRIDPFVAFIYELLARFYPIFVINVALLTFINLCCLVRSKFMALKKMLSDSHAVDPSDGGSDGVWRVKLVQTMPRTFHDELKQIASVYESLYAIANRLNHIFGLTNLASLSLMAISLTCHLFLMVKILMERPASIDGICIELFGVFWLWSSRPAINFDSIVISLFSIDRLDAISTRIHHNNLSFDCRRGGCNSSAGAGCSGNT